MIIILNNKCQILGWRHVLCCTGNPSDVTEIREDDNPDFRILHLFWHQYLQDVKGILLLIQFQDLINLQVVVYATMSFSFPL